MRHAFRRLLSNPAFSLTAAITLAAAIGANALIFSVVNGVLLKPLPFAEPERLVGVWHVAPGIAPGPMNQAPSTYFTYREDGEVFQDIGLWDDASVTVTGRGEPEQVEALMVTDGTLPLLGVRPGAGPHLHEGGRCARARRHGDAQPHLLACGVFNGDPARDRPDTDGQRARAARSSACCPTASASSATTRRSSCRSASIARRSFSATSAIRASRG